jgi:hypothetical protein
VPQDSRYSVLDIGSILVFSDPQTPVRSRRIEVLLVAHGEVLERDVFTGILKLIFDAHRVEIQVVGAAIDVVPVHEAAVRHVVAVVVERGALGVVGHQERKLPRRVGVRDLVEVDQVGIVAFDEEHLALVGRVEHAAVCHGNHQRLGGMKHGHLTVCIGIEMCNVGVIGVNAPSSRARSG